MDDEMGVDVDPPPCMSKSKAKFKPSKGKENAAPKKPAAKAKGTTKVRKLL
jgi:hypothetical protein